MGTESIEASFLSIFALISFFIFLIVSKYSYYIKNGALLDKDFLKPQAFHDIPTTRSGGVAAILSLTVFLVIYYLLYSDFLYDYFFIGWSMFIIGFLDDLKIKIKPLSRLILMIILLFSVIFIMPIKILNIDIPILTHLMNSHIFSSLFVLLCFLFIINGANLIDGFNGLLTMNLIIINIILAYINMSNEHFEFSYLIIAQIIILLSFLLFNFPHAKIFLGDSGAYLMGSLASLNIIITNNLNSNISSFFFCTLLFYIFFEVFFSFFRKLYLNKSPLNPDSEHLHMLTYFLLKKKLAGQDCNYLNSLLINFIYIILISPSLLFINNGVLCRYWFFLLLIVYLIFYLRLKEKINENN